MKAKVVGIKELKRQWSMPDGRQVKPHFILVPFFTKEDGASFTMRYHILVPDGSPDPPMHTHPWEHQTFTICGQGVLLTEEGEMPIREGTAVIVPSGLPHIMVCRGEIPWVTVDCISKV